MVIPKGFLAFMPVTLQAQNFIYSYTLLIFLDSPAISEQTMVEKINFYNAYLSYKKSSTRYSIETYSLTTWYM